MGVNIFNHFGIIIGLGVELFNEFGLKCTSCEVLFLMVVK